MMHILFTGGSGYVGSKLLVFFDLLGCKISVITRDPVKNIFLSSINVYIYDGSYNSVEHAICESNPDYVVHLASMVSYSKNHEVSAMIDANIRFGTQLLEAMTKHDCKCFINTSTYWQHYGGEYYSPLSLYAATKEAFEKIIDYYTEALNVKAITLELFDVYGEDDSRDKIINLVNRTFMLGNALDISPGEQEISPIHISDVINAYKVAINIVGDLNGHNKFSVFSGECIKLKDLIVLFEKLYEKKASVNIGAIPYRRREMMVVPSPLHPILPGWKPNINFEHGLRMLVR